MWPKRRKRKGVTVRARCIIRDREGKLLVQWDPLKNAYTLPGGRVEFDENIAICLLREMREEAGIDVKPLRLAHVVELVESSPPLHEIIFYFECEYTGTPRNLNRYVKLEWRRIEDIKDKFWPRPLADKLASPSSNTVYYIAIVDGDVKFVAPVQNEEGGRRS